MSQDKKSILARFDEVWRMKEISNQSPLEEFLRFAASQEECRIRWEETAKENQKLKRLIDESKKEINNLEMKLSTARKLLDQEKNRKLRAEEEKNKSERQLQMVRDLLFTDNRNQLHDETKQKLQFLNSTNRSRGSNDYQNHLNPIQELDSTGSMLSDLSYSRSEDDLDSDTFMNRKRTNTYQSMGCNEISRKKRRSHIIELNGKEGVVATTKVTVEHDGSMSAHSQIETIPATNNQEPTAPNRCGSLESVESGLSIENITNYNHGNQVDVGVLPIGNNRITNQRFHNFISKTVFRPEDCEVCEKRIKFTSTVLRCQNCTGSCHPACKDGLPLPCIAPGSTPISKKMGVLADYAPSTPPKVPAIIQHCINEIEARGLNEHGIYRVVGSNKDIKALKFKFMKSRGGVPRLADVDVHVLCGCLKDFLLSLKEPLVTHALWWNFARASETKDAEDRRSRIYQAISQLPAANRDTLAFIILHLIRVAESKETNKMCISNLSSVLGPTIVGYGPDYTELEAYSQTAKAKLVLEQFLKIPAEYWSRVLSSSGGNTYSTTPLISDSAPTPRTPSTRSLRRLFDHTPAR